jgi:hypothetical protein
MLQLWVHLAPWEELSEDREASLFRHVCEGRCSDGVSIYRAASAGVPIVPDSAAAGKEDAIRDIGRALVDWVRDLYGDLGMRDAPAWTPERLEYSVEVEATTPDGHSTRMLADPGRDGDFDWYAFDVESRTPDTKPTEVTRLSVVPGRVAFPGMPNPRWWDFEQSTVAFVNIQPDKRDLAKLVFMQFMLVQGNDWFMIPLDLPLGIVCRIDTLIVEDVFGERTLVERADAHPAQGAPRWTLFSIASRGTGEPEDYLLVPPTVSAAAQVGPLLEETRFLRDEMANMVWAVEHATENGIGEVWPGHERDLARRPPPPPATEDGGAAGVPLTYVLQTVVPEHWIPFLPVAVTAQPGDIALERSFMPRSGPGASGDVMPLGRVLRPSRLQQGVYRVFEEEVPREGVRVSRVPIRSRWTDGSTHLWIARRKIVGSGEGSSGLRFDLAVPAGLAASLPRA